MVCALCKVGLPLSPIVDASLKFCCHGCHAVYQILDAKAALSNYQEHPVFIQALKAGLISNNELLDELSRQKTQKHGREKERLHLEIGEMWCPSCAELIRLVLLQQRGVIKAIVDYATDLATIEFSPFETSKNSIETLIAKFGYIPRSLDAPERKAVSHQLYFRFIIAMFCSLNVMMLAYPLYSTYFSFDDVGYGSLFAWVSFFISIPVVTYCAWPIFTRCWHALLIGIVGMEALVSISVSSAFIFSTFNLFKDSTEVYFDSMTVVIAFVLLGKIIESKAKFSAKASLIRLHKGIPKKGRKKTAENAFAFVNVKDIYPKDTILVLTGEKIVLDGVVLKGRGVVDESLMTGESMPIIKQVASKVLAGSILQNGSLEIEVTSSKDETVLHKILQMIENDIGSKSAYVRAVDPFIKMFVPFVLALAGIAFLICLPMGLPVAMMRMMTILLISCPCAIGIAAPLAESHLMHALTALGVVIKNRGALQFLGKETAFVFDKTGTITKGVFEVNEGLEILSSLERDILKSMASNSCHPISIAIAKAIGEESALSLDFVQEHIGKGLIAKHNEKLYLLGSKKFLKEHGLFINETAVSNTTVFFSCDGSIRTKISLGDEIRNEASSLIASFKPALTMLLSGDSSEVVQKVAKACNFSTWAGESTPLEKREAIEGLKKRGFIVCMIGDGINDAPALTSAHVGISVLSASDISIQVSDILLTTDNLSVLLSLREIAKKAHRIIVQNLFWAFFYNIIGIGLALSGLLSPIFAAAAMVLSSLMVLFNAQRLSGKAITSITDPSA